MGLREYKSNMEELRKVSCSCAAAQLQPRSTTVSTVLSVICSVRQPLRDNVCMCSLVLTNFEHSYLFFIWSWSLLYCLTKVKAMSAFPEFLIFENVCLVLFSQWKRFWGSKVCFFVYLEYNLNLNFTRLCFFTMNLTFKIHKNVY